MVHALQHWYDLKYHGGTVAIIIAWFVWHVFICLYVDFVSLAVSVCLSNCAGLKAMSQALVWRIAVVVKLNWYCLLHLSFICLSKCCSICLCLSMSVCMWQELVVVCTQLPLVLIWSIAMDLWLSAMLCSVHRSLHRMPLQKGRCGLIAIFVLYYTSSYSSSYCASCADICWILVAAMCFCTV